MKPTARELLARSTVKVRRGPYSLGSWPLRRASAVHAGLVRTRDSFHLALQDDLEMTALVRTSQLRELPPPRQVEPGWAVLTIDTLFAWDVVGILAELTMSLASAGIPVGALTAFSRDHLIVQEAHLDGALEKLGTLCKAVQEVDGG